MIEIKTNVGLSGYTTFGVGGKADWLVTVKTKEELLEALSYAREKKIKFVVIGGGSNVLISDDGFRGLTIINRATKREYVKDTVIAESGASLTKVASGSLDNGYLGFEFGIGIPGTIGGAVAGNVGTKIGNISDILVSAEVWHDGKISVVDGNSLDFDYRYSNIKGKSDFVILSAKFRLQEGDTSSAKEHVKDELKRRTSLYRGQTAGSYFKNPEEGKTAAELIDSLGLKGYHIGGAEVSTEHANVFRNAGGARAHDFYELEKNVTSKVLDRYGITLQPEVMKLGDFI